MITASVGESFEMMVLEELVATSVSFQIRGVWKKHPQCCYYTTEKP